ncbi:hypothetical protein [Streptomyces sp. WG7]|uniref:hypothetical protein n=1 Tax=Streptomyces sp. WG7 TaxID=3417650 RepID=UPI003CEC758B
MPPAPTCRAHLEGAVLDQADLSHACPVKAELDEASLRGATLDGSGPGTGQPARGRCAIGSFHVSETLHRELDALGHNEAVYVRIGEAKALAYVAAVMAEDG